jgi:CheY-like chemotaxis protein/signal transduction histidine kinase
MARILVVEDDALTLEAMRELLSGEGHDVRAVPGVTPARQALWEADFDVVLSDWSMPDGTGVDVLAASRETQPTTPVIVATAAARLDVAVEALRGGAFDFVTKPTAPELLLASVQRALRWHQLQASQQLTDAAEAVCRSGDPDRLLDRLVETAVSLADAELAAIIVDGVTTHVIPEGVVFPADAEVGPSLSLPLVTRHHVAGLLWVVRARGKRPFTERDAHRLAVIAAEAALALDNVALVQQLKDRIDMLERARGALGENRRLAGVGRMATDVAARLRSPLEGLRSQLADAARLAEGPVVARIRAAEDALARVDRAIDDLGRVARLRQNQQAFEAARLVELGVRTAAPKHDVRVIAEAAGLVHGDPGELARGLAELIENADLAQADHADPIEVRVRSLGAGRIRIEVADRGPGMGPAEVERYGEAHFSTRGRAGLGVSNAQAIAARHGGYVRVVGTSRTGTLVAMDLPSEELEVEIAAGEEDGADTLSA